MKNLLCLLLCLSFAGNKNVTPLLLSGGIGTSIVAYSMKNATEVLEDRIAKLKKIPTFEQLVLQIEDYEKSGLSEKVIHEKIAALSPARLAISQAQKDVLLAEARHQLALLEEQGVRWRPVQKALFVAAILMFAEGLREQFQD